MSDRISFFVCVKACINTQLSAKPADYPQHGPESRYLPGTSAIGSPDGCSPVSLGNFSRSHRITESLLRDLIGCVAGGVLKKVICDLPMFMAGPAMQAAYLCM